MKPVCSACDPGWGSLVDWVMGSRKDSRAKDSGHRYNQIIKIK